MTAIIDAPRRGPRFESITSDLVDRIRRNEFPSGTALPSATALAAEYGVARGTIRHALELLEERHAMLTRNGVRWIVHEPAHPAQLQRAALVRAVGHRDGTPPVGKDGLHRARAGEQG